MSRSRERKVSLVIVTAIAFVLAVSILAITLGVILSNNAAQPEQPVSFKLHVNPADPVIMSAETSEGDVIYMLGNKSKDTGIPTSVNEFRVENDDSTTLISVNNDGTLGSAYDNDGSQISLVWDANQTTVHVSIVFNNGSEQLTINVNFSEPIGNITDREADQIFTKRSLYGQAYPQDKAKSKTKRQSSTQTYASVFVSTETCNEPESNAAIFADVFLDYGQQRGSYEQSAQYNGIKTSTNGEYEVRIPTSLTSDVGERSEAICDAIEMKLSEVCDIYSKANRVTKFVSGKDFAFCFLLGNGLRLAFPALRLFPIFRFCKNIFKPLKWYCKNANEDIKFTETSPVELLCDSLPLVDNGVDFHSTKNILLTPSAVFPQGNRVQGESRVLSIRPGDSQISDIFHIVNDRARIQIMHFSVTPSDPAPAQKYTVAVSFSCYSSTSLVVMMSIVGTDGYSNVVTCYTGPDCFLLVPGAKALVRDDIVVDIQNENDSISRKVVVIF